MGTIIDYVRANTSTFDKLPPNRVDCLVFSWLAYLRIAEEVPAASTAEGISLKQLVIEANMVGLTAPVHDPRSSESLLLACALSPRFSDVYACQAIDDWSHTEEKQFSATTFALPCETTIVAFRGTDNTLTGWKECLNMAFLESVPAQQAAVSYLERVAREFDGNLIVTGHSKGGNLAEYAFLNCDDTTAARIGRCIVHDSPGFSQEALAGMRQGSVEHIVPEESLVGMLLFGRDGKPTVVRSTTPGIMQHSPFSWEVEGADFKTVSAITYDAYRRGKRINSWLAAMMSTDRERFVETLFKLVQATGEVTATGLVHSLSDGSLDLALRRLDGLPAEERSFFLDALGDLAATMLLGPAPTNPQTPTERTADAASKIDDIEANEPLERSFIQEGRQAQNQTPF